MTTQKQTRSRYSTSICQAVGTTPLVGLRGIRPAGGGEVMLKLEMLNPAGSVKDRIGCAMVEAAERDGSLKPGGRIIEPTSGNTGIALAFIAAARGYELTLCMPESMSLERRAVLHHLGAQLVLTPAAGGMATAVAHANELFEDAQRAGENVFMPQQFDNPANPAVHEATTGPEIAEATGGDVAAIVTGVGTGGTITGVTRYMRTRNPAFQAIAVEPDDSAVLSGEEPGPHKIQGIGAGFVPGNLDRSLVSGIERVTNDDAFAWAQRLAKEEGVLCGISTGANVCAAMRVAERPEFAGKRIVTIACSIGERYLSTPLFEGP